MRYLVMILFSIGLLFFGCTEPDDTSIIESKKIQYVNTILGGCNNRTEENIEHGAEIENKFEAVRDNDTIKVFTGLNYICCTPFNTDWNIQNDTIYISITDTCAEPYGTCYCRCECYYTFEFNFNNLASKKYYWQIKLGVQFNNSEEILDEGYIALE